ncbi:MAG: hypothetical protein LUP99_03935 [Methanomicrobiales archaeon]|nr:hypothetical protein [Methanomicrobiales archaeon]
MRKQIESRDSFSYQRRVSPCTRCGHPVHPSLAITQDGNIYCAECVKALSLSSHLDNLEPAEGESMEEWLGRWKQYRERCIDDQLARVSTGPKKRVRFRKPE